MKKKKVKFKRKSITFIIIILLIIIIEIINLIKLYNKYQLKNLNYNETSIENILKTRLKNEVLKLGFNKTLAFFCMSTTCSCESEPRNSILLFVLINSFISSAHSPPPQITNLTSLLRFLIM